MTTESASYIQNVNEGIDTLHDKAHLTESCNTDDIVGRKSIDRFSAAALVARGQARWCEHCNASARGE